MLSSGQSYLKKIYFCGVINNKTLKTMQNLSVERMRLGNRLAAGKRRLAVFPNVQKSFVSFESFVIKN